MRHIIIAHANTVMRILFTKPQSTDKAFLELVGILDDGFQHGYIYNMDSIYAKYLALRQYIGDDMSTCQMRSLRVKLANHCGDKVLFECLVQMNLPLLVVPNMVSDLNLLNMTTNHIVFHMNQP